MESAFVESGAAEYAAVHGWLTEAEAVALFYTAHTLNVYRPNVVEIGSFLGRSAVVLSAAIQEVGGDLFCVDTFEPYFKIADPLKWFRRNTEDRANVWPHKTTSVEFAKRFTHAVHMVFIDGDHSYEGALADLDAWTPLLVTGGVLAVHDVFLPDETYAPGYEEGPHRALETFLSRESEQGKWNSKGRVNTLFIARKGTP